MPVRNVDLLQDRWHAAGRYQRQPSPHAQRLIDEMFPPVPQRPARRNPGGYSDRYLDDMGERIVAAVGDQALTRHESAARLGLASKYIGKALTAVVSEGLLTRNNAAPGITCRYWRPDHQEAE